MSKTYKMPFDWNFDDNNPLIYVDTSADGIKEMVNTALNEALDDVKAEVVNDTIDTMNIQIDGENLLYTLLVKGENKGEINIPKDQFLKSASYDKENKKLIFVMETTDGDKTTEVSISELVEAIEEKNVEQDTTLAEKADKTEVDSALETINTKNTEQDAEIAEKAVKSEVDAALDLKADKTELEPLAKSADVTAEIASAVEPLATKEELTAEVERATAKENEINEALNVEALRATAAESELEGKVTAEQARAEQKEAELSAKDEEIEAKKVDWTVSEGERKHIVLKNHDNILGTATDGGTYNLAMVSKWDVADFGSAQLHLNLNSKDAATLNDDKVIATEDVVDAKVEAAVATITAKDAEQDAEIALKAVKSEVDAALELKADKTELEPLALKEDVDTLATNLTAADSELEGKITAEQARAEAKEAELAAKVDTKTDKFMDGANGKALIFNEADGGGAKFEHNDGTWSFTGVNDGGENGIAGQIYVVKKNAEGKMEGTRIDMTKGALYYTIGAASAAERMVADNEIAVKGDVAKSVEGLAKASDVTAEIAAAVEPLATKEELTNAAAEAVAKVVAEAPEDLDTLKEVADYIAADKTKATEIENKLSEHTAAIEALEAKDEELNTAIVDEATRATTAESELTGKVVAEQARAEAKEAELAAKDEAQDAEIANKVDWTESTPGRNHIVLKNHDSILGTTTDGSTYNVAMVSKWDVADFGSSQLHLNLNSKDGSVTINDDKVVATKDEVEAVDAKVSAIDLTPFAKTEDVNAELALKADKTELEPLATKAEMAEAAANAVAQVVASAPEDLDTLKEVADYIASDKTKAAEIETKLSALEAKDVELAAKDEAQDAVIDGKVDRNMNGTNGKALIFNEADGGGAKFEHNDGTWSFTGVNDGGENGIAGQIYVVKKNAEDKMEGTRIDMTKNALYYTVGSASAAERMVADNEIAVKGDVAKSVEGLAKSADVTAEIASAVSVLNAKDEAQDAEIALKADSDKVYSKEVVDNTLEGYVPVEKYNDLKARLDNLEIMMSVYNAEREAQMDEIINNMSSDNKELVIDTLMESIVVPETTVAYTITAPLTDNSTVELTSPKYMTLINTSKEPVSTTISHEYVEGETTSATSVYLVGDFNTLTLENISPNVKSGYDAASVKDVVITENNVKNLSLYLDFQDGATITNNSDKDITIYDRSNSDVALSIVAPNSTVTLNNGQFTTLSAEVSDNTLIIKKNVHIDNLNLTKGNAIVEVARAEEVAGIVENYTVADGYTLSHRVYHITNDNSSKLGGVGEMILDEDITRTSSLVSPLAPAWDSVWNLNGHNISFVKETPRDTDCVAMMRYSSVLEVNGEGEVYTPNTYGLWTSGTNAKIVVNSGKFTANTHVLYCEQGTIEVNGGEFHMANDDAAKDDNGNYRFLLNCLDKNYNNGTAKIIVKGGKFYDFDPANCAAEGVGTNFVAEGYESVMTTETIDGVEHKVYEVKPVNG